MFDPLSISKILLVQLEPHLAPLLSFLASLEPHAMVVLHSHAKIDHLHLGS